MPANDFDQRLRELEIWRGRVDAELTQAAAVRVKYVPILESLLNNRSEARGRKAAANASERHGLTRRQAFLAYLGGTVLVASFLLSVVQVFSR